MGGLHRRQRRPRLSGRGLAKSRVSQSCVVRLERRRIQATERLWESDATGGELGQRDVARLDDVILGLARADVLRAALILGPPSDEPVDVVQLLAVTAR